MSKPFGLRENLTTLFRHKRSILGIAVIAAGTSFAVSLLQSKVWETSARVLVQQNRAQPRIGSTFSPADTVGQLNRHDQVRTEVEIFLSPLVLQRTVDKLGAEAVLEHMRWRWDWLRDLPSDAYGAVRDFVVGLFVDDKGGPDMTATQLAMRKLSAHMAATPVRETDVFAVALESPDPQFAAHALNALMDVYLAHHLEVRQGALSSGVFAAETARLQKELDEATARLQTLKAETGVISPATQKQLLLQRLSDAESALNKAAIDSAESRSRIAETQRQIAARPAKAQLQSTDSRNPLLDALRSQLTELEKERAQYQPDSTAGRQLDREMNILRERLRNEQEKVASSQISGPDATYQEMERELALERSRLTGIQSRGDLMRQIESYRAELGRLDRIEADMRELSREVDLKEEALRISLRKQEEESLGSLLNSKRISDVTPIERAMVPDQPARPRKWMNLALGLAGGLIAGLMLAYLAEYFRRTFTTREDAQDQLGIPVLACFMDRAHGARAATLNRIEARRLAEALLRERRERRLNRVLFVSTHKGEGRSTAIEMLETHLRAHGVEVLRAQNAGADDTPGNEEARPLVLIEGSAMADDGAGDIGPDTADGVILVVEAERTTGLAATGTLREIEAVGGRVIGAVLNRRRHFIPDWAYGWLLSPRQSLHT